MTLLSRVVTLALTFVPIAACGGREVADRDDAPETAAAVTTVQVKLADRPERLEAGGVVTAAASATISSRVIAPVIEVRARAGDRVRAGQVLVVLDDRDLAAHARQASAALTAAGQGLAAATSEKSAAMAEHKLAAAWQARITSLHTRNSATAQELDEAEARLAGATSRLEAVQARIEQATATVAAARAAADAAAATHSFTEIKAPFDGLVTETLTDPGNMASPGMPLLRMDAMGTPRVEVTVDESRARFVRVGDRVDVLVDRNANGESEQATLAGTVTELARAIASDQRAFTVKVSLPKGSTITSGTFARVAFHGPVRKALFVPTDAVRRQGQLVTAFVVQDDTARLRLLQTGAAGPDGTEVLAGLDENEVVVTSAPPDLVDGQRVRATARATATEDRQ